MSKQLTLSATLSVLAMAALAFSTVLATPERDGPANDGAATAHGSLAMALVRS